MVISTKLQTLICFQLDSQMSTELRVFVFLFHINGTKHSALMQNFVIFSSLTFFELEFPTGVLKEL